MEAASTHLLANGILGREELIAGGKRSARASGLIRRAVVGEDVAVARMYVTQLCVTTETPIVIALFLLGQIFQPLCVVNDVAATIEAATEFGLTRASFTDGLWKASICVNCVSKCGNFCGVARSV